MDEKEALVHLSERQNQLIKRFQASLKGQHTHNIKFPKSYYKGNIRCELPFSENDPYVHSGSVNLRKRFGYSQNAAYIKANKGLLAEFYHHGRRTSMFEEIQQGSELGCQFMALLETAENKTRLAESEKAATEEMEESEEEVVSSLYETIMSMSEEAFPDHATDPQVYAFTEAGEPELLLSPVAHTGVMYEINLRLKECEEYWLKTWVRAGTGNDVHTYGDLVSDTGGMLRVLRSLPPVERKKGEFRLLMNRLKDFGHLYQFGYVTAFFKQFNTAYIDEESGEQRVWTTYRQNQVIEREAAKIAKLIFSQYRQLNFFFVVRANSSKMV